MKKKNLLFLALIFLCIHSVFAQFGAHVGPSFSSVKFKADDDGGSETEKFDLRTGFMAGFSYTSQICKTFAIQPELNFLQKGGKKSYGGQYDSETNMAINYLELPVYFLYNGGKEKGLFAGIGPAFNFGLSGKVKYKNDGDEYDEDIKFGEDEDMRRFHMAVNIIVIYQLMSGLNFGAFVSQSLTNSALENDYNEKMSFFNFGVRAGFKFGGGMQKIDPKPN